MTHLVNVDGTTEHVNRVAPRIAEGAVLVVNDCIGEVDGAVRGGVNKLLEVDLVSVLVDQRAGLVDELALVVGERAVVRLENGVLCVEGRAIRVCHVRRVQLATEEGAVPADPLYESSASHWR